MLMSCDFFLNELPEVRLPSGKQSPEYFKNLGWNTASTSIIAVADVYSSSGSSSYHFLRTYDVSSTVPKVAHTLSHVILTTVLYGY